MRAAIERFKTVEHDADFATEKKMAEVQRAIDEATNLETPLLKRIWSFFQPYPQFQHFSGYWVQLLE